MTNSDDSVNWTDPRYIDFQVVHGYYDPDGWLGGDCEFQLRIKKSPTSLLLKFWNPDFSLKYRQNRVHIRVQEENFVSPPVSLGEIFLFKLDFEENAANIIKIKIRSESITSPNSIDQRERGIILSSGRVGF